jgi:hypothetical protein
MASLVSERLDEPWRRRMYLPNYQVGETGAAPCLRIALDRIGAEKGLQFNVRVGGRRARDHERNNAAGHKFYGGPTIIR